MKELFGSGTAVAEVSPVHAAMLNKFHRIDRGVLVVPKYFNHSTCLADLREANKRDLRVSEEVVDLSFKPQHVMHPGERFKVDTFSPKSSVVTISEYLALMALNKGLNVGAQGTMVFWDQMQSTLHEDLCYFALDGIIRDIEVYGNNHLAPVVVVNVPSDNEPHCFEVFGIQRVLKMQHSLIIFSKVGI